jgi:DNA-binding NtrC family response regulator
MNSRLSAALVHDRQEPFSALKLALEQQGIDISQPRGCEDLRRLFKQPGLPRLVFTDTTLPDGTWKNVLDLAANAPEPVHVIVVAPFVALKLYLESLESGAFDFIVPPFLVSDLAHIVRCATWKGAGRGGRPQPEKQMAAA